jgi:hypothetical protein
VRAQDALATANRRPALLCQVWFVGEFWSENSGQAFKARRFGFALGEGDQFLLVFRWEGMALVAPNQFLYSLPSPLEDVGIASIGNRKAAVDDSGREPDRPTWPGAAAGFPNREY